MDKVINKITVRRSTHLLDPNKPSFIAWTTIDSGLTFYCDNERHLVCVPYSKPNLHRMAKLLDIKRGWYHRGILAHYDIPKSRIKEIQDQCHIVSSRVIVRIIKNKIQTHE